MKKVIWIDMDGVLVDFQGHVDALLEKNPKLKDHYLGCVDQIPGIFRDPPPINGAISAVKKLYDSGEYELYIATAAPWGNPESATDKRYWIEKYFGDIFHKKMCITHLKHMLIGDYLIDDRLKNGADRFTGTLLQFGTDEYPDWDSIIKKLL
jgi:5'(3')-deoxyribonucleotidase